MAKTESKAVSKKILIVDDEEALHALLTPLLKREGYGVLNAKNGEEALHLLGATNPLPSLILLDVGMPVMNGVQFRAAQKTKPNLAKIPVIVITTRAQFEQDIKTIAAAAYLKKPIEAEILLRTIESHLA